LKWNFLSSPPRDVGRPGAVLRLSFAGDALGYFPIGNFDVFWHSFTQNGENQATALFRAGKGLVCQKKCQFILSTLFIYENTP
jgi:hypothetical protein